MSLCLFVSEAKDCEGSNQVAIVNHTHNVADHKIEVMLYQFCTLFHVYIKSSSYSAVPKLQYIPPILHMKHSPNVSVVFPSLHTFCHAHQLKWHVSWFTEFSILETPDVFRHCAVFSSLMKIHFDNILFAKCFSNVNSYAMTAVCCKLLLLFNDIYSQWVLLCVIHFTISKVDYINPMARFVYRIVWHQRCILVQRIKPNRKWWQQETGITA